MKRLVGKAFDEGCVLEPIPSQQEPSANTQWFWLWLVRKSDRKQQTLLTLKYIRVITNMLLNHDLSNHNSKAENIHTVPAQCLVTVAISGAMKNGVQVPVFFSCHFSVKHNHKMFTYHFIFLCVFKGHQ